MVQRRISSLIKAALIGNVVVFLYFYSTLNSKHPALPVENQDGEMLVKSAVTVIFIEFEFFHHDLVSSVSSVAKYMPHSPILIIAENEPYPPLNLQTDQVQVVKGNVNPLLARHQRDPIRYVKTKYVIFFPDGIRIKSSLGLNPVLQYAAKIQHFDALVLPFGDGSQLTNCQSLQFDVRNWSLYYSPADTQSGLIPKRCQSVQGNAAIFMESGKLQELSDPFARPFNEGFFMQASLRNWNLTRLDGNHLFHHEIRQFKDDHNREKYSFKTYSRQMQLYNKFGVKKRLLADGSMEYFGCSKKTPRCFGTIIDDMPSFIIEGKWTPPCCLRNLRTTAQHVFEIFDEYNVKYWLEGGSLLGAARYKDIIPWDYDVDIGMFMHDITELEPLRKAQKHGSYEDPEQFIWSKATEGDFFRVQFSQSNHLHVDIFPFYERDGIMTKNYWFETHRQDMEFPAHFLQPLKRLDFVGVKALVPNNYVDFLELKFGKGVIDNPKYPNLASAA